MNENDPEILVQLLERRVDALESTAGELREAVLRLSGPREPSLVWVDTGVDLSKPGVGPVVLRYPDGSVGRGSRARILGPCEVVHRPEGYGDGKHVAVETWADVDLEP